MYITLKSIRRNSPCEGGWKKLLAYLGKTKADDEPLSLLTILDSNGIYDALWCLRVVNGYDREIRLFSVWCARRVQNLMTDQRSLDALDVAGRYALGAATDDDLTAAWAAAWAAARAAKGAAARAAKGDAKGAAKGAAGAAWAAEGAARAARAAWAAAWAAGDAGAAEGAAGDAAWAASEAAGAARAAKGDAAWAASEAAGAAGAAAWAARAAWAAARAAERAAQEVRFREVFG